MDLAPLRKRLGPELIVLIAVALTAALGTLILFALDYPATQESLVVVGGLSGAVASAVTRLVRVGGGSDIEGRTVPYAAVFVPFVSGFAAGAFSVLTALALFSAGAPTATNASAAVFGGIYGLLLGGWANALLSEQGVTELRHSLLQATVADVTGVLSATAYNYNGTIAVWFIPKDGQGSVAGSITIGFAPRIKDFAGGMERAISGPVRIDEGQLSDKVPFDVSILTPSGFDAYPRSRMVQIPAAKPSDLFDFTLVRQAREGTIRDPGDLGLGDPTDYDDVRPTQDPGESQGKTTPVALVDVSQAGRTVQLLEIPLTAEAIRGEPLQLGGPTST